jgi:hypothetical protein
MAGARRIGFIVVLVTALVGGGSNGRAQTKPASHTNDGGESARTFDDAQRLFYSGKFAAAADLAQALRASASNDLALYELRTSALHFQLQRAMGPGQDKEKALRQCASCPAILSAFRDDISRGQALARARLKSAPNDDTAQFFLGKIDLNHVWLHLATLGEKTGWSEYWEARHSLDALLARKPDHIRARVARAWIDYIVETRVPWGFRWILGGGNKKRALATVQAAAANPNAEFFVRTEAGFALWEMLNRERRYKDAAATARELARDFPENQEIAKFLAKHGG